MTWLTETLRANPELAIFLTLAVGFLIGRVRIGSFKLGNVRVFFPIATSIVLSIVLTVVLNLFFRR